MVAGAVAGQAAKAAAGKTASGASKAAGKAAGDAAGKGGKFGIQTPSQERHNSAAKYLSNNENTNSEDENSEDQMNYTGGGNRATSNNSNSLMSKFKNNGGSGKGKFDLKKLSKASPVLIASLAMVIIPIIVLVSGVSLLGSLSENAGFSDIPVEALEFVGNKSLSRMLENGSMPSTLAEKFTTNGLEVGYLDTNGSFIAGLRPNSENSIALASSSDTTQESTNHSLVIRFKDKLIDSSNWEYYATTDPEVYAAYSESTNFRGIAYYDDLANSYFSNVAGNSRNVFASYSSDDSGDFRDIITKYINNKSDSNYTIIDSRCYNSNGDKVSSDFCKTASGTNITELTTETSDDEKRDAIEKYLNTLFNHTLIDCDAQEPSSWTAETPVEIMQNHYNSKAEDYAICDNIQASIIIYLVNSALAAGESKEAETYFLTIQEAISKTKAGEGASAPINELFNFLTLADENGISAVQSPTLSSLLTKSFSNYNKSEEDKKEIAKYSLDRTQNTTSNITYENVLLSALTTTASSVTKNSNASTSMVKLLIGDNAYDEPASPTEPSQPNTPTYSDVVDKFTFTSKGSYSKDPTITEDYKQALEDYKPYYSTYKQESTKYDTLDQKYNNAEKKYTEAKILVSSIKTEIEEKEKSCSNFVKNYKNGLNFTANEDCSGADSLYKEAEQKYNNYPSIKAKYDNGEIREEEYKYYKYANNNYTRIKDDYNQLLRNSSGNYALASDAYKKLNSSLVTATTNESSAKDEYKEAYEKACEQYEKTKEAYEIAIGQYNNIYERWWKKTVAYCEYQDTIVSASSCKNGEIITGDKGYSYRYNNYTHKITNKTISSLENILLAKETTFLLSDNYKSIVGSHAGEIFSKGGSIVESGISSYTMGGTAGTEELVASYQKEIDKTLALRAKAERLEKSPFDVTSQNTFLGSIINSFANYFYTTPSLSSSFTSFSSLLSQSLSGAFPSVFADSNENFHTTYGDCPESNKDGTGSAYVCNVFSSPTVVYDLDGITAVDVDKFKNYLTNQDNENNTMPEYINDDMSEYINQRLVKTGYTSHEIAEKLWSDTPALEKATGYFKQLLTFFSNKTFQWVDKDKKISDYFSTYYNRFNDGAFAIITGEAYISSNNTETDLLNYQAFIITDRLLAGIGYYDTSNTNTTYYADAFIPGTGESSYLANYLKNNSTNLNNLTDTEYLAKISGLSTEEASLALGYIMYNSYLASLNHESVLAFGEEPFNIIKPNNTKNTTYIAINDLIIPYKNNTKKRKEVSYAA